MCNKCVDCDEPILPKARRKLGYTTCLTCGDKHAKQKRFTVAPMHKSNYMLITDHADLRGLNSKGGLIH